MLLVIFGAGASYDSLATRPVNKPGSPLERAPIVDERRTPFRPPLADDLFASTSLNEGLQRAFAYLHEIIPDLSRRRSGETVEDVLFRMQSEAATYPRRHRQLMAARLYIQALLRACEQEWIHNDPLPMNHQKLLDRIEQVRRGAGRAPLFVTFNYDRLIEHALQLRGQPIRTIDDYVAPGRIGVLKLHGSIDWARALEIPPDEPVTSDAKSVGYLLEHADALPPLKSIERLTDGHATRRQAQPVVPALALPYRGKTFECPDAHLAELRRVLPEVRAVLAIGWSAGEEHFLAEMQTAMREDLLVHAVCGRAEWSQMTIDRLRNLPLAARGRWVAYDGGFSDYVLSDELMSLLQETVGAA